MFSTTVQGQGYLRKNNRTNGDNKTPPPEHDEPVFVPNAEEPPPFVPN